MEKKERKDARRGILAHFQFSVEGKSKEVFKGITTDVSPDGFGFLTETPVKEGQTITITKHALQEFTSRKAKILWVNKEPRYFEAGATFSSDS